MNTKKIAIAGVFTALVFVMTYLIRIPIPATEGYINMGDAMILLGSFVLGPFAAIPAGLGSALADLMSGYAHYIIPTLIIKSAMGGVAGYILSKKKSVVFRLLAFIVAELIMVAGYFGFESLPFMYGVATALLSVPFNLIQGAAAIITAFPISFVRFFTKHDKIDA